MRGSSLLTGHRLASQERLRSIEEVSIKTFNILNNKKTVSMQSHSGRQTALFPQSVVHE